LPFGNLRESAIGKKRANLVIVTKCPAAISSQEQDKVKQKLNIKAPVFFTSIDYDSEVFSVEKAMNVANVIPKEKVIVVGIAKPKYFIDYLNSGKDNVLIYPDHHNFTEQEISVLNVLAEEKMLVTTEKDFVRLNGKMKTNNLFYLPIKSKFLNSETEFQTLIRKIITS
jgi:tetraacyldisaccharide 4'-kinase